MFGLVFGGTVYYWGLARESARLADRLPELEQEHGQVKAGLQRAAKLKEREEAAARVESAMRRFRGRTWWPVLLEFQELTPPGLTWEAVEGDTDRFRLRGWAGSMAGVAQFVTGLSGSGKVTGVDVHQVRQNQEGRFELELTVRLAPGEGNG